MSRAARFFAALAAAALLFSVGFAGTGTSYATVSNASDLETVLSTASSVSGSVVITYTTGVTSIEVSDSLSIPSNTTLDLSGGNTLRISGGTFSVYGTVSGGGVEVTGGTLVRQSGCSITSSLTVSGSGTVRGARTLTLENLSSSSSENIVSILYEDGSTDTTSFVTRAANGVIYQKMTGGSYSSYKVVSEVATDAGHVFRLGTKNTDVLSLEYVIEYGDVSDAVFTADNPSIYTASDSAVTLNNPAREGYRFDGWTCAQLGISTPAASATIPEGTTGALTFIANWSVDPMGGGGGGGMSGGSSGSAAAASATDDATSAEPTPTPAVTTTDTTSTQRIGRGKSSTKVTFSSEVDAVEPTLESLQKDSFPWGWTLLGVGGAAVVIYVISWIVRKRRENK